MSNKTHLRKPLDQVFFRASKIGLIVSGYVSGGLTENQMKEKEDLENITNTLIGITEKQEEELERLLQKQKEGKATPKQFSMIEKLQMQKQSYRKRTPKQEERLKILTEKLNRPPQLSQGAKSAIKEIWLENEKEFKEEIFDKKLKKGIQAEEDAITLISKVDNHPYWKNTKKEYKGNISGECDVRHKFENIETPEGLVNELIVIDDTKASWNPRTFMQADLSSTYEWQLIAYMYLYDADIARLRYCLVDCPEEVYQDELRRFCYNKGIIDETLPEYKEVINQFRKNYFYSKTGLYTEEERVKTFTIVRDSEKEQDMLNAIELAKEYYLSITLNMIE